MNFRFDRYMQNLDISDNVIVSLDKTSLRDLGVISLVQLNTVSPLSNLTSCTPTTSNLYLANSLAAALREHAL